MPLVSIIMPVYNAEKHLHEAIDSILNQTFTDFEFIIINDGSTDESEAIILSYTDPRIKYHVNEKNLRLIATLNRGFDLVQAKYIVRMDADDVSLPQRLERQVAFMEANPKVAACGSWAQTFEGDDVIIKYKARHDEIMFGMLFQCHLVHPTVILRTEMVQAFKPQFDLKYAHAEDYDFFVRLGYKYQLANIQEVLVNYRVHAKSVSKAYNSVQKENSNIIRHNQYQHLHCKVTDQWVEDFIKLNHHAYTRVKSTPAEVKHSLEEMLKANNHTHVFNKQFFEKTLSHLWFHYCYSVSTPKIFYSSKALSALYGPTALQKVKWQVKSIKK